MQIKVLSDDYDSKQDAKSITYQSARTLNIANKCNSSQIKSLKIRGNIQKQMPSTVNLQNVEAPGQLPPPS
jgi:hypothetical protein